jgi:hypothetical protein
MANRNETFVPIEGFPNYSISDKGKVLAYTYNKDGALLKPQKDAMNYLHVRLYDGTQDRGVYSSGYAKPKLEKIHRLVAKHFLPEPPKDEYREVNHIDGNKQNNDVTNLEWVTRRENIQHAWDLGLATHMLKNGKMRNAKPLKLIFEDGTEKYYTSQIEAATAQGSSIINMAVKVRKGEEGTFGRLGFKAIRITDLPQGAEYEDVTPFRDEIIKRREAQYARYRRWEESKK